MIALGKPVLVRMYDGRDFVGRCKRLFKNKHGEVFGEFKVSENVSVVASLKYVADIYPSKNVGLIERILNRFGYIHTEKHREKSQA